MRISQHHRMAEVRRNTWEALCSSRVAQSITISRWILNITSNGDFTTSPGNLCRCSVTFLYSVQVCALLFYSYFRYIDIYLTCALMIKYMLYLSVCLQHTLYISFCALSLKTNNHKPPHTEP